METKLETIQLSKSDVMEIIYLINKQRLNILDDSYDDVEWEYYFSLNDLETRLIG